MKWKVLVASALATTGLAGSANALTFNYTDIGGAGQGTQARLVFDVAAAYWSSIFTNDVTVNIDIGYASFGPQGEGILGRTGSSRYLDTIGGWEAQVQATASNSGVDTAVVQNLPKLSAAGGVAVITPGYTQPADKIGIDTSTRVFDNDDTANNQVLYMTTANAKALGYGDVTNGGRDARIQFNSDYGFDFEPRDGTDPNLDNFTVVAIHELGHALGFTSGVDDYDFFGGPNGPCFADGAPDCGGTYGQTYDANNDYWASALDMFRYSTNPEQLGGEGPKLDWAIRDPNTDPNYTASANPYFSIDGGATRLFDNYESRGQFNGSSYQASHWRITGANNGDGTTQPFLGIMDPVAFPDNSVTALDIAAFDAIGWNSRVDALNMPNYRQTSAQIFAAFAPAPEPATWAQMILGFGLIGAWSRRRTTVAAIA